MTTHRTAIYARVSTMDQNPEGQIGPLREYSEARGFDVVGEFVDHGVSGTKSSRPALDEMMSAVRDVSVSPADLDVRKATTWKKSCR